VLLSIFMCTRAIKVNHKSVTVCTASNMQCALHGVSFEVSIGKSALFIKIYSCSPRMHSGWYAVLANLVSLCSCGRMNGW